MPNLGDSDIGILAISKATFSNITTPVKKTTRPSTILGYVRDTAMYQEISLEKKNLAKENFAQTIGIVG